MPWKDPNTRRAKRAARRAEIRAIERAWYQLNRERVLAKRRAKAAEERENRPPKPPPDLAKRREKMRAKGRKQRQNPVYRAKANRRSTSWRVDNPEKVVLNNKAAKARARRELELLAGRPRPEACDICGRSDRRIHFDHDHQRGHFRGWICNGCNMALGLVADDATVLRKMIAYLERTATNASPQGSLPGI